MAVRDDGLIAGSVSGGCVESAVVEASADVVRTGVSRLLEFGVSDETAWAVGLACGGKIKVYVERRSELQDAFADRWKRGQAAAMVTLVSGAPGVLGGQMIVDTDGRAVGSLGGLLELARAEAVAALSQGASRLVPMDGAEVFIDVSLPPTTLVVVGGVHIAVALTSLARELGYRTIVVDPRPAFGNSERFPHVDRILASWPDEAMGQIGLGPSTAVAVLTHDPKLDDPALRESLPSTAFYVGALGSKATQAKRKKRLLEAGLSEAQVARLHAPIGLDLGGRSPEEVALAVLAQVVAVRHGRTDPGKP
jgi:xanthine dehydrogenase accessory factor